MQKIKKIAARFIFLLYRWKLAGKKVWLIDAPRHSNLGDQAITEAELQWINKYYEKRDILEISTRYSRAFCPLISQKQAKDVLFIFQGGGNMGVEYFWDEELRQMYMERFPHNKMIIMPQTMDYGYTDFGKEMEQKSVMVYGKCSDLTLCAREKYSFDRMNTLYKNHSVFCTPDIVLSWRIKPMSFVRTGILFCVRHDKEKYYSDAFLEYLEEHLKKYKETIVYTDTIHITNVPKRKRNKILTLKLKKIASTKLMVTDRLHGMIFAALTGTPCIVLSNYNYKVRGEYEWLKELEYIKYAANEHEACTLADYMMKEVCGKEYKYPYLDKDMEALHHYFETASKK